jgi:hypothetical protein
MWASEHSVETSAAPEQIWRLRADVAGSPEWNGDIERIELIGAFTGDSTIVRCAAGGDRSALAADAGARFSAPGCRHA